MKLLSTICVFFIAGFLFSVSAQTVINNFDSQAANLSTNSEAPSVVSISDNNTDFVEGTGSLNVNAVIANVHDWGTFAMVQTADITEDWTGSKDDTLYLWIKVKQAPADPSMVFRIQLWDQPNSTDTKEAYIFEDAVALDNVSGWYEEKIPFNERTTDGNVNPDNSGFVRAPNNWFMGTNNGTLDFDKIVGYDIVAVTTGAVTDSVKLSYDGFVRGPKVPLPVELTSFSAAVVKNQVKLSWSTATEKNNKGFEVERKQVNGNYEVIGFIHGAGTSTKTNSYSYVDSKVKSGNYTYRLKQLDFDGKFEYSKEINTEVSAPVEFALKQNYPNPFNPSTTISYQLPVSGKVIMKVYNALGIEVATLVNENKEAGSYNINFNASNLSSGVYIYKLSAGSFVSTKKMILLK